MNPASKIELDDPRKGTYKAVATEGMSFEVRGKDVHTKDLSVRAMYLAKEINTVRTALKRSLEHPNKVLRIKDVPVEFHNGSAARR